MAKCLVTGGAGFIGSHVVDYLIKNNHEVTILDDLSGGLIENVNPKANFVKGSIVNDRLVDELVSGKDIVYHLAAYAAEGLSPFIRRFNYMNNLIGSINLINSSVKNKVKRIIYTSSIAVYGNGTPPFNENDTPTPEDPYGISKLAVEMDLKDAEHRFGLEYTILRPYNVYGERQFLGDPYRNVIGIFMNNIMLSKPPVIFGDGKQKRAFTYVGDVAPCIAESAFISEAKNQIINLGASKEYTVKELSDVVIQTMNFEGNQTYAPPRQEVLNAWCNNRKAKEILNYQDKTSLLEGINKMALWAKSVGPMKPIIWESYELKEGLPSIWQDLPLKYPDSKKRIDPNIF